MTLALLRIATSKPLPMYGTWFKASRKSALRAIPLLSRSQSTISISAYLGEQPPGACLALCCPLGEIRRILARKSPCLAPSHARNGPSEPGILSRPTLSRALIRGSRQWILLRKRLDFLNFLQSVDIWTGPSPSRIGCGLSACAPAPRAYLELPKARSPRFSACRGTT
jgi:hypothetical protein